MQRTTIIFSGERHGKMLRGKLCNRVFIGGYSSHITRGIPALARGGVMAHIHEPINSLGYSFKLGIQFVIIHLN